MDSDRLDFSRLDYAIAKFLMERSHFRLDEQQHQRNRLGHIIRQLSASLSMGHSCLFITPADQQIVQESGLLSGSNTPLVLEDNRLYLQRYWHYETRLAKQLSERVKKTSQPFDNIDSIMEKYFQNTDLKADETDWQRRAAKQVTQQSFSIITGGPGTGKTTTILKILAILQELQLAQSSAQSPRSLTMALAAPTGKAAMRLQESMGAGKKHLHCSEEVKRLLPDAVTTIHRLLGAKPASPYFRHNQENPLVHDLVVIDEASMVDLALMSKLVDALKPDARLILLGDKDQLASVESGAILGDLSRALPSHTTELKKSWRFKKQIKNLASAINQQQRDRAWELLISDENPDTSLLNTSLLPHILTPLKSFFDAVNKNQSIEAVFSAYNQFQVLCANRKGKFGVEGINHRIEQSLQKQGVNTLALWYHGKPVIITRNDPASELFNGDIGICLYENGGINPHELFIYFQLADGKIKRLLPTRLPQHETAYALTIHKSQGSEFDHVLVVLPDTPNPVLSKELIYTAITRAKQKVEIYSNQEVFNFALDHKVERQSGLSVKIST